MSQVAEKNRVLFVDDDQAILDGLEDLFFRDRNRWEMSFALGGVRALAALHAQPYDVVVSDMRMLGMDGATLLAHVKREFPGTVRMVLSGFSERASIVRALTSMHQYFSKPCDPVLLREAIERALVVVGRSSRDVRALIGGLERLPSPPLVYLELTRLAGDPASTTADAGKIVAQDPALAAKALQLANSVAFGPRRALTSIDACVAYLGIELIRYLALASSVFAWDPGPLPSDSPLEVMQTRARLTATLTCKLVGEGPGGQLAFTAGLLHDIGEAVLAVGKPVEYAEVRRAARAAGASPSAAEQRAFGATHAEVGACLLGMWGLPKELVALVAYHDAPLAAPPACHRTLAALHVADALAMPSVDHVLDEGLVGALGCAAELAAWRMLAEHS